MKDEALTILRNRAVKDLRRLTAKAAGDPVLARRAYAAALRELADEVE